MPGHLIFMAAPLCHSLIRHTNGQLSLRYKLTCFKTLLNVYLLTAVISYKIKLFTKLISMKPGLSKFDYYFNKLQPILTTAAKQKNPALWLYRNDARTPLFMLEGLAKMYTSFHNKKKFTKIKEHFKLLEDTLGAIDYYDSIAKDLGANKKVPATVIAYLQAQSREKIQSLNEVLLENDWLLPENSRIDRIREKLQEADWLEEEKEVDQVHDFYGEAIYELVEFTQKTNYQFTNLESGIHEMRRKLRWLSIYPQALRGTIQLHTLPKPLKHLTKYLSKEITTSPFNIMPDVGAAKYVLILEQNYFFALSWMIAELGRIKDNGLHIIAIKEALQQAATLTDEAALKKIYPMLGIKQTKLPVLLEQAGNICKTYFKEQNLEHLVTGVNKVK